MEYILLDDALFILFTDRLNLACVYLPLPVNPKISKPSLFRVERWEIQWLVFRFTIFRITGESNVLADNLSRWGAPSHRDDTPLNLAHKSALLRAPEAPFLTDEGFFALR